MPEFDFIVPGDPVPKPRMTKADVWKQRPAVLRYREYGDRIRDAYRAAGALPISADVHGICVMAWIAIPKSWSAKKRDAMDQQPHRQRMDADNILKSVADHLFEDDCALWTMSVRKIWSLMPMTRIVLIYELPETT